MILSVQICWKYTYETFHHESVKMRKTTCPCTNCVKVPSSQGEDWQKTPTADRTAEILQAQVIFNTLYLSRAAQGNPL